MSNKLNDSDLGQSEFLFDKTDQNSKPVGSRKSKIVKIAGGGLILLILICILIIIFLDRNNKQELIYVFEIVRHGARTPAMKPPEGRSYGFNTTKG